MNYIRRKVEKWKEHSDYKRASEIYQHLWRFWSPNRRKDLITEILLTMNFSNEDLVELSNLLGYTAHMRERSEK